MRAQTSDQLLTWKTVFLITVTSSKRWGETFWTCPTTTDLSFISKTQVLGKCLKCVLSCTIPTLNHQLSNGMAEDRLLFPIWALRFYLDRSMPWREHKRLLFVSFKLGHKQDIVPSTISGWIWKRFWSATQIPLHLSLSPTRLRRTRCDPWLHRSHCIDRPPWNRFRELIPGAVITPSWTFISRTVLPILFN